MPPRKKDPKLTLHDVQAWCNREGYWLLKQPLIMVGTIQTQIYREASGELVIVTKQSDAKGIIVGAEEG